MHIPQHSPCILLRPQPRSASIGFACPCLLDYLLSIILHSSHTPLLAEYQDPKSSHHLLSLHYPSLPGHSFCVLVRFCVVCFLQRLFSASMTDGMVSTVADPNLDLPPGGSMCTSIARTTPADGIIKVSVRLSPTIFIYFLYQSTDMGHKVPGCYHPGRHVQRVALIASAGSSFEEMRYLTIVTLVNSHSTHITRKSSSRASAI